MWSSHGCCGNDVRFNGTVELVPIRLVSSLVPCRALVRLFRYNTL